MNFFNLAALAPLLLLCVASGEAVGSNQFCNYEGSHSCVCEPGYTGANCETPIDFCNSLLGNSNYTFVDVCQEESNHKSHGTCSSSTSASGHVGAKCHCHEGWEGPLCTLPTDTNTLSTRCFLWANVNTKKQPNIPVGCAPTHRCLPDNLNCPFNNPDVLDTNCPLPIGWCLPQAEFMEVKKYRSTLPSNTGDKVNNLAVSGECSGHGQGFCECNFGYSGAHCKHVTDFCTVNETSKDLGNVVHQVCGSHALSCKSTPAVGFHCDCKPHWSGPFCDIPDPIYIDSATRCYLFAPGTSSGVIAGVNVGCPTGQRCIPDNVNCPFDNTPSDHCPLPIGWCLPETDAANSY